MQFHAFLRLTAWSVFPLGNGGLGCLHKNRAPSDWFDFLNASVGADYSNDFHRPSESDPFGRLWILRSHSADDSSSAFDGGLLILGPDNRRQRVGEGKSDNKSVQTLHTLGVLIGIDYCLQRLRNWNLIELPHPSKSNARNLGMHNRSHLPFACLTNP